MKALQVLLLVSSLALLSGCISTQNYGSVTRGHVLSDASATRTDVFINLGQPDAIYKGDNTEVFFYNGYIGRTVLGIYTSVKRMDRVVVMDNNGNVVFNPEIEAGRGATFLPSLLNGTYPYRTNVLTDGPQNWTAE